MDIRERVTREIAAIMDQIYGVQSVAVFCLWLPSGDNEMVNVATNVTDRDALQAMLREAMQKVDTVVPTLIKRDTADS
jgi:hypothetical protein